MRTVLIDMHNQTAAGYPASFYYPQMSLTDVEGSAFGEHATHVLRAELHIVASGGVTVTVEQTAGRKAEHAAQLGADTWQDITASLVDLVTNAPHASYVNTNAVLDLSGLVGRFRVKAVIADATNDYFFVLVTD